MVGIVACGAYVPRLRLQRRAIFGAIGWSNGGLKSLADGERSMANWDEDAITMAVEAARDALPEAERGRLAGLMLASTSAPFSDRQNAAVVKEALNLSDHVAAQDAGGSLRAATSALLNALHAVRGGSGEVLCIASEKRFTQPGSELEFASADAAAALLVGNGDDVAAEFLAGHSVTVDFVDHFREAGQPFDYAWEPRWVRDEGYAKIAPQAIKAALTTAGLTPGEVDRFLMPSPMKGVAQAVAKACGIAAEKAADALWATMGDAGAAQPFVLVAQALEMARAGEIVVLAGFGQGCDALVFRATGRPAVRGLGVSGWLARRQPETNYVKYLALAGHLALDRGMRAELDQKTPLTALYRNRKAVMGLVGGRCTRTGVVQFPKSPVSVAQNDRAAGTQEDYPLAERGARVVTHTADNLTYSPAPPCYYGTIDFDEGGRMVAEFADMQPEDVQVGARVRMMFRIKAVDEKRGFTKYFWKAAPDYRASRNTLAAE